MLELFDLPHGRARALLDRGVPVFLTVNPVEYHGPHLSLHNDRLISLGTLAAGVAHEIRNPLTGVCLLLDDLHDHLAERPKGREMIQKALAEMERLENLVNGLLDFAAPSRRSSPEVQPIEDVINNTLFLVQKQCKNRRIRLSVRVAEPLPPLSFDPERLRQALLNLLLNAIEAMPDGGDLSLHVDQVLDDPIPVLGPSIRIVITDTGKGILPEDIEYIFDPFFSRNPSGVGLGLAIVHSIVEEHGGRITVSSNPGHGTTFRLDLPIDGASKPQLLHNYAEGKPWKRS